MKRPMLVSAAAFLSIALLGGCGTAASLAGAPLGSTLGREGVDRVTNQVFAEYLNHRSQLEPELVVQESFWTEVRPRAYRTVAPVEGAREFLSKGFRQFLNEFETFVVEQDPRQEKIVFAGINVLRFFGRTRCAGSPCSVPPCCGDSVRCWKCT